MDVIWGVNEAQILSSIGLGLSYYHLVAFSNHNDVAMLENYVFTECLQLAMRRHARNGI